MESQDPCVPFSRYIISWPVWQPSWPTNEWKETFPQNKWLAKKEILLTRLSAAHLKYWVIFNFSSKILTTLKTEFSYMLAVLKTAQGIVIRCKLTSVVKDSLLDRENPTPICENAQHNNCQENHLHVQHGQHYFVSCYLQIVCHLLESEYWNEVTSNRIASG